MPRFAHRLFAVLLLTSLSTQGLRSQAPDAFAEFRREADALVAEAMDRDKVTGVSLLVAFGEDVILAKGYGLADVEHEVPVTPETVFQIGSVTKVFTMGLFGKAVSQGAFSRDTALSTYGNGALTGIASNTALGDRSLQEAATFTAGTRPRRASVFVVSITR